MFLSVTSLPLLTLTLTLVCLTLLSSLTNGECNGEKLKETTNERAGNREARPGVIYDWKIIVGILVLLC